MQWNYQWILWSFLCKEPKSSNINQYLTLSLTKLYPTLSVFMTVRGNTYVQLQKCTVEKLDVRRLPLWCHVHSQSGIKLIYIAFLHNSAMFYIKMLFDETSLLSYSSIFWHKELFHNESVSVVEVKQVSCFAISVYTMVSTIQFAGEVMTSFTMLWYRH